jgi:hypothetical protein
LTTCKLESFCAVRDVINKVQKTSSGQTTGKERENSCKMCDWKELMFYCGSTGVWTRGLVFGRQTLYHSSHVIVTYRILQTTKHKNQRGDWKKDTHRQFNKCGYSMSMKKMPDYAGNHYHHKLFIRLTKNKKIVHSALARCGQSNSQ